jgi:predicted ABC-type transport system involved in lysophospholipase L1 biosynthesis ATPase subunit
MVNLCWLAHILLPLLGIRAHTNLAARKRLAAPRRSVVGFIFLAFNLMPSLSALDNVRFPAPSILAYFVTGMTYV